MKIKFIVYMLIVLNVLCVTKTFSQEQQHSFFNDSTWNTLLPLTLSPDGQWAIVGNRYNNNPRTNKLFFINTKTKETRDLTHLSGFFESILNNGLTVGKINNKLIVYSLNQKDSLLISNDIKLFNVNTKENLLFYLEKNNDFTITRINEKLNKNKIELSLLNIDRYYLSPNSNTLVVLNKQKELIQINLNNFTSNKIIDLKGDIKTLKWNLNQDGFVIHTNNKLNVIDLNSNKKGVIDITENDTIENLKLSFFSNNDLYVSYGFNSNEIIPDTDYLDIWQGNSKQLLSSDFQTKYKKTYKAFVYKNKQDELIPLEKNTNQDYLNIGIPGYLLSYNYYKNQDFKNHAVPIEYSLYDISKKKNIQVVTTKSNSVFNPSIDGKHILYSKDGSNEWEILNIKTLEKHPFKVDNSSHFVFTPIWSQDSKTIFYSFDGNLYSYNLQNKKTNRLTQFTKKDNSTIQRLINKSSIPSYANYINTNNPFYFSVLQGQKKSIYVYEKQKAKPIYTTTKNIQLSSTLTNTSNVDSNTILFSIEDYNLPPSILSIKDNTVNTLMESNINKNLYLWRKRIDFNYTDKYNKKLNGYLFYPKNYDPNKKYPMVVQVYDLILLSPPDKFTIPTHVGSSNGFNSAILTENEYFVLSAQTYVTEEGPGVSATEGITNAVEKALEIEPSIDKENLGLIGHSFGGYKAASISVLSDMFKASVSGAGAYDLIGGLMFRYSNYRRMPDWFMAEYSQSNLRVKFSEDPEKYYKNSPLLNAYKTNTAMLLFTGIQDENIYWKNTQKMFIALKREQKPVIALFYKNINHGVSNQNPIETIDLSKRVLDWFNYHLKENKEIKWIKDGIDYNTYSISPI
ncbi:prolyl oligopeptidase family serine peptidase [Myroides marinus]|uniref:S9 family peptidase n=1 Tax=Myroides marinus TaxID=703342 RepID=UPI0025766EEF|nr:prolyl oligopeptidase family serine peptidase [Myroides marinus]MDM1384374.1 prolyl oligopeptidase family serine peptidase [Myroides marinus]